MKFEIKSVGPFNEIEMDILPITVISGMNNTGKTVLCRSFYHTFKLVNSDQDRCEFEDNEDCELWRINNKRSNSIYYVGSHYLLEDETKISPNDTTLPKRIEGILTYVKNDLTYIDKDGKFTCKRGEQKGMSSGLKIFVKLESLLRGDLKEGDMIILDNVEIFTHPHYQLYLAELIVLIQKLLHVSILVVTNSLYLLDALDKFTLRHSDDDYYKNIAFYLVERSGLHSTVRNVSTELEIVYGHLYAPTQSLMNMEYGVYNDYDCMIQES